MSYAGKRYADYASFISPIFPVTPGHNYWDKTPKAHTVEEIILFSEQGTCSVFCNGITYQIPTPAFIWNKAGSYHMISDFTVTQETSYLATFTQKFLEDVPSKLRCYDFMQDRAMFAMPLDAQRLLRLETLFASLIDSPMEQRSALLGCVFHQISLYLKSGVNTICSSNSYSYISKVIAVLEQLENTKLTTAALAGDFHVGKTKLETDFKKCTGYTIHAFRQRVQLQAARHRLITTEKTLSQIANECGFTDRAHLIRCFRAEYGITPGEHRKNYKNRPR